MAREHFATQSRAHNMKAALMIVTIPRRRTTYSKVNVRTARRQNIINGGCESEHPSISLILQGFFPDQTREMLSPERALAAPDAITIHSFAEYCVRGTHAQLPTQPALARPCSPHGIFKFAAMMIGHHLSVSALQHAARSPASRAARPRGRIASAFTPPTCT
jgi:hypothetical protein